MEGIPVLDRVVSLKMSAGQVRRAKAAARAQGQRFGVWARNLILERADQVLTKNGGGLPAAPPPLPGKL